MLTLGGTCTVATHGSDSCDSGEHLHDFTVKVLVLALKEA